MPYRTPYVHPGVADQVGCRYTILRRLDDESPVQSVAWILLSSDHAAKLDAAWTTLELLVAELLQVLRLMKIRRRGDRVCF